jgi:hypothetical protein
MDVFKLINKIPTPDIKIDVVTINFYFNQECSDSPRVQIGDLHPGGAAQGNGRIKKGREAYSSMLIFLSHLCVII